MSRFNSGINGGGGGEDDSTDITIPDNPFIEYGTNNSAEDVNTTPDGAGRTNGPSSVPQETDNPLFGDDGNNAFDDTTVNAGVGSSVLLAVVAFAAVIVGWVVMD